MSSLYFLITAFVLTAVTESSAHVKPFSIHINNKQGHAAADTVDQSRNALVKGSESERKIEILLYGNCKKQGHA